MLVADGTYTGVGNVNLDFGGRAITVRSQNGAASCIIDCENVDNTRGFYFHSGEGAASVVDGFTIRNGMAIYGGGIYCDSSPTITNNIITGNQAHGTGIDGAIPGGGGIFCQDSSPMITNNVITGNHCISAVGGGIYCGNVLGGSVPTIVGNTITGNSAEGNGSGIYCGFVVVIPGPYPEFYPTIKNNTISSNSTNSNGGGIYFSDSCFPTLVNNTISANSSSAGGGIACDNNANPSVTNTILWSNSPQEIYFMPGGDSNTISIDYSDVQGGLAAIVTNGNGTVNWGTGNIDSDPQFVNAASDDYHLMNSSPCISAGTNAGAPATDIEGNPRPDPAGSISDIGAYENNIGTQIIAATAGNNGSINPSGDVRAIYGIDQIFTIAADPCYHVADVVVDGVSVGAVSTYTFTNVTADHTIYAAFDNQPPLVNLTTTYDQWERGTLTIAADAQDTDGSIASVLFQYSLDDVTWNDLDTVAAMPYSMNWDTTLVIPTVDDSVWVRAIATDNDGMTGQVVTDSPFGVDNEPSTTSDDYDTVWDNRDFYITLTADDGSGSGVANVNYRINDGAMKSVSADGQPKIHTERDDNRLEYWSIDNVGNEEQHHVLSDIKLDKTPPATSDDYDGEWHNKDFYIILTGDDNVSRIAEINYRVNNGAEKSVLKDGHPKIYKEGSNNKLEYWSIDNAGNEEERHIISSIKLDKTAPILTRWEHPAKLTQIYQGAFRVKVKLRDLGGSNISGVPLFDYHIGVDTDYDGYEAMVVAPHLIVVIESNAL